MREKLRAAEVALGRSVVRVGKLETQLDHARAQVAWFHRNLFGQKREHIDTAALEREWSKYLAEQERTATGASPTPPAGSTSLQLLLMLGGPVSAEGPANAEAALAAAGVDPSADHPPPPAPPKPRSKHGRRKIPDTLDRVTVVIEPDLGGFENDARRVDCEVSYRIGIRPAEVYAIAIERPRYAIDLINGKTRFESAPPPFEMIERGLFAPSALAHLVAMKWERHVPFNRTAVFFKDHGYELPVSTLSGASIRAEPLARALVDAMTVHAKQVAPYLAIDATGARLQARERCTNGHTWMRYIEDVAVLVSFTTKHDAEAASGQLDGWRCPFLSDGASVFNEYERTSGMDRHGCHSHGRRKFFYASASDPRALVGVRFFNRIFDIERELVAVGADARLAARKERSAPIFAELIAWCRNIGADASVGPRSLLSKSARYVLNQEDRLRRFLENGWVPIHNNLTELQIRHFAVGRKNWLFYGSERAAKAGSTWMSLVLSARMHALHVETYLRELFRVLPSWPKSRLVELAPHAWLATRKRLVPAELDSEFGPTTIPSRESG